jgi:hypothetical protein
MKRWSVVLLYCLGLWGAIVHAQTPAFADLPAGVWTNVPLEGGTCLYGTPYSLFVRPSDVPTDKLMIYFDGGGACWDGVTCADKGRYAASYEVTDEKVRRTPEGFFDYSNPENPVRDYHAVFVPYCSGDAHTGDSVVTFDVPSGSVRNYSEPTITVNFQGVNNARAALAWVYENVVAPSQVLVAGCSAGGYGALYHAGEVMAHYDGVPAVMLADASNGVTPVAWEGFNTWNILANLPAYMAGTTAEEYSTTLHILATAQAFPNNRFAQVNTALDRVQVAFYGLMRGQAVDFSNFAIVAQQWGEGLLQNLTALQSEAPNFVSYTAGGLAHCITPSNTTYRYTVAGVRFVDWVRALLNGADVDNVACDVEKGECFVEPIGG